MLLAGPRVLAGGRELIDTGTAVVLPAGVVAIAEHRRAAGPQGAVADPAGSQRPVRRQRRSLRLPALRVRASRAIPAAEVPLAHSAAHRPVIASVDDAGVQRQVAVPAGLSRRGELREGDPAGSPPPLPVRGAQALPACGRSQPLTAHGGPPKTGSRGSKTRSSARNSGRTAAMSFSSRRAGARYCRPAPVLRVRVLAAHRPSSSSSKTVAVTLTVTPLRTPRACR